MDTGAKTESIKDLMESIEKGEIVLPEFQRDFVWDVSKTYDLFDSLMRDIFVGSLIYGVPSFEITVRELDTRPRTGAGSRRSLNLISMTKEELDLKVKMENLRLLLDGQQRATALYRALIGVDVVWIIIKREDELDEQIKQKSDGERSLEDVLQSVSGEESGERLSIKLSDVYKMLCGKISREKDKSQLLASSAKWQTSGESEIESSKLFDQYITYSNKLQELLRQEKLLSFYLLNTNEEKFALFFERSNSKGIQLSFIDILAAKLYKGFNLRQEVEDFEEENRTYELNKDALVRTIAYIESDGKDIGRNYILKTLTYEHFKKHWKLLCSLYLRCFDYLSTNNLLLSQSWMSFENMIIPLMVFLREVPSQEFSKIDEQQKALLEHWYWASILSSRYSGAAGTTLIADSKTLAKIARKEYSLGEGYFRQFKLQITTVDDILNVHKKYSALYKGVLNLINYGSGGFQDWRSTSRLSFNTKLDDHHIFPKEYLRKILGIKESDQIDCVANRTLIPRLTNIEIGDEPPSTYLKELQQSNQQLPTCLQNHLITDELIGGKYDKKYDEFIQLRAQQILKIINNKVIEPGEKLAKSLSKQSEHQKDLAPI